MPNSALTNLTSGEISQSALGRPDIAKYPNACERLENFLLTTTGMWSFRPGFGLMGLPKYADRNVMLRAFRFSDEQGNQIEIGDRYARIWHALGLVLDPATSQPVELVTPFPHDQLDGLGFCQSADFLFVCHESLGMFTIQRASLTAWAFASFQLKDGPYGKENGDATLIMRVSAGTGGDVNIEAVGFPAGKEPFGAGDEGRLARLKAGGTWLWLIVSKVADSTHLSATPQNGGPGAGDYTDWRLGLYSNRLGWPAALRIHEQRLVLAGPAAIPDRLDGSAIAGFDDFAPRDPLTDDGPWAFALGMENVDRIVALGESNDLLPLTTAASHRFAGDSVGSAITATQVYEKPISDGGAKRIAPVNVGNAVVYVDNFGLSIPAIAFDFRFQNYAPDDLTLLADHMCWLDPASKGFQGLQWQGKPFGNLWTVRGNGELAGALYNPTQNVLGWHRHPMGMPVGPAWPEDFGTAYPAPAVESISVMRGPTWHELWAVVSRELPDRTLRTIERMGRPGLWETPFQSQCYLDCSLQLANTPAADLVPDAASGTGVHFNLQNVPAEGGFAFTADHVGQFIKRRWDAGKSLRGRTIWKTAVARITARVSDTEVVADIVQPFAIATAILAGNWGLTVSRVDKIDHLEGQAVAIVSDGRVCAPQVVVNGAVALDLPGWEVAVGLPYVGIMVGVPIDPGPQPAVGMGRNVRVNEITVRLLNSIGGEFASVPETDDELPRWEALHPYSQAQAAPSAEPVPFTGIKRMWGAGEWTRQAQIAIRQTQPLPLNVQLVVSHVYAPFVQP